MAVTQDPEAWARLGTKIREQRESLGMSRRQLSEAAGVSEKSIQVAEEGRTPRARWPQSLRLIETALRWEPGSMLRILEGGDPEPVHDLLSLVEMEPIGPGEQAPMFPNAGPRSLLDLAHEAGEEFPTSHTRSKALASLSKSLRTSLAEVLSFGRKAVNHGADEEVAERYEEAVEALLMDLVSRPAVYVGASPDPGHLAHWRTAMRMDPVLKKEREERLRAVDREQRRIREAAERRYYASQTPRTPVVGEVDSGEVLREIRRLADEVARLAKKVDGDESSATE